MEVFEDRVENLESSDVFRFSLCLFFSNYNGMLLWGIGYIFLNILVVSM